PARAFSVVADPISLVDLRASLFCKEPTMTKHRVLSRAFMVGAIALVPVSSALAGGGHWSHGPSYRAPAWHGGYHGAPYAHGGYWRGGIWWPAAAAAAVVGTAAALVAAPFIAFGNAVAGAAYVPPQDPA